MLRGMAEETQFVIVTHSKRMMVAAGKSSDEHRPVRISEISA